MVYLTPELLGKLRKAKLTAAEWRLWAYLVVLDPDKDLEKVRVSKTALYTAIAKLQILAYSAFYPEHQKRLHLFGNAGDESKVSDIGNSCLAFGVVVSFELVGSEVEEV